MLLTVLELTSFRNFSRASIHLSNQLTLVVGNNGQGKTNLLEAVYLLLQGRDFRTSGEREAIQCGQNQAMIQGTGEMGSRSQTWRHTIPLDGRRSHTGPISPVVLFSPEDVYLAKGSPERRRRFMDLLLAAHDPRYARSLKIYTRVLLQRNRALKESAFKQVVDDFTPSLIREGLYIWTRRQETLQALMPDAQMVQDRLAPGETISGHLQYGGSTEIIHTESQYEELLRQRHPEELARQTTLVGPHRDDLVISLGGLDTRVYASQGQLRTVALSIKLGTYAWLYRETSMRPIILLDDVLSELDVHRRQAVLDAVSQPGQQTVITDTEPRSYATLEPRIIQIDHGEVTPWVSGETKN